VRVRCRGNSGVGSSLPKTSFVQMIPAPNGLSMDAEGEMQSLMRIKQRKGCEEIVEIFSEKLSLPNCARLDNALLVRFFGLQWSDKVLYNSQHRLT
jgi:hypothetical protein